MSSPSKQVASRRLPPINNNSGTVSPQYQHADRSSRHDKSRPNRTAMMSSARASSSFQEQEKRKNSHAGQLHDIETAFHQGPFRVPLHEISFGALMMTSPPLKQNKPDGSVFLHDLSVMDPGIIFEFLKNSPELIHQYVQENVSKEEVVAWLDLKSFEQFHERLSITELHGYGIPPAASWKTPLFAKTVKRGIVMTICVVDCKDKKTFAEKTNTSSLERQQFMEKFISEVQSIHGDVRGGVLYQLVDCCAAAVKANTCNLYLADSDAKRIWKFVPDSPNPVNLQIVKEGSTIACYVATSRENINIRTTTLDDRFPQGLGMKDTQDMSVLCQPIIQPNGGLSGVIELIRFTNLPAFIESDIQVVNGYLTWGSIVLHYAEMYHTMHKQRKLNEFLLNVTKSIFQDIVTMDTVIMKIMNFAQTLVDADRTSLFLVDNKTKELYARIFDIGTGLETKLHQEIRFPKSKGVAGHVATTGETLNIKNAYGDPRFNRDIDILTGYKTHTLLCMPIFIRGDITGVVQMVNKKRGVFTTVDEKAFQTFAVYCGLALHHAKLYDKIRRSEQKYKVAIEVLSYHSMCTDSEVNNSKNYKSLIPKENLLRYDFNVFNLDVIEMSNIAVNLFDELFQLDSRFDIDELIRFTLTVRKNYRRVPYHNWTHAFTVAHCMYCLVKSSNGLLTGLEAVALYVSCLCHDLDHRGKNNEWMKIESTPLAAVYTTSTLEHHHFNQTITILQHEGHNIFSHLNSADYKNILGMIKECILATDLVQFFGNKGKLTDIVNNNLFDWENSEHRRMFRALSMTACDLSACAKPWKIQYETVKVIFQEFYAQGDEEKALGRTPMPMMDRNTADKLPNHQVNFLLGICIPGYELLQQLIPGTKPLLEGATKNVLVWKEMVKKQNEEKEQQQKAEIAMLEREDSQSELIKEAHVDNNGTATERISSSSSSLSRKSRHSVATKQKK